jgi:hypothetical protein
MVKGVNRRVIEINRPDSDYFERAVLYLKPDVSEVPLHAAQTAAEDYFSAGAERRGKSRHLRGWLLFFLGMLTSAGAFWAVLVLYGMV